MRGGFSPLPSLAWPRPIGPDRYIFFLATKIKNSGLATRDYPLPPFRHLCAYTHVTYRVSCGALMMLLEG